MNNSGREVVKALVRLFVVVNVAVIAQPGEQNGHCGVRLDVFVLVLDRAPEPCHENVVKDPTTAVSYG